MYLVKITSKESNQRVDKYVRKLLNDAPLSFIYKIFRKKDVKVNGHWVKIEYILQENDELKVFVTDDQLKEFNKPKEVEKQSFPHDIVYEDHNILIVNKPKRLLVHGDSTEKRITLSNQVLSYLYEKGEYNPRNKGFTPAPAHRLDRNTSGLVVFGKNLPALQALEDLFKDKSEIEKHYLALVVGKTNKEGQINAPLLKDDSTGMVRVSPEGKTALTLYKTVTQFKDTSLVDVNIITGRTHQIRVHFKTIDHPVVGDSKYGNFNFNRIFKDKYNLCDQFLHAYKIVFKKPEGVLSYLENKTFEAPLFKEEKDILNNLKQGN